MLDSAYRFETTARSHAPDYAVPLPVTSALLFFDESRGRAGTICETQAMICGDLISMLADTW